MAKVGWLRRNSKTGERSNLIKLRSLLRFENPTVVVQWLSDFGSITKIWSATVRFSERTKDLILTRLVKVQMSNQKPLYYYDEFVYTL